MRRLGDLCNFMDEILYHRAEISHAKPLLPTTFPTGLVPQCGIRKTQDSTRTWWCWLVCVELLQGICSTSEIALSSQVNNFSFSPCLYFVVLVNVTSFPHRGLILGKSRYLDEQSNYTRGWSGTPSCWSGWLAWLRRSPIGAT